MSMLSTTLKHRVLIFLHLGEFQHRARVAVARQSDTEQLNFHSQDIHLLLTIDCLEALFKAHSKKVQAKFLNKTMSKYLCGKTPSLVNTEHLCYIKCI